MKIQRHDKLDNKKPEIVGPITGAKLMTSPTNPIAVPRFSGGYIMRTVLKMSGIKIPVAIP